MASRYKWYRCAIPSNLDTFIEKLISCRPLLEEGSWFKLSQDEHGYQAIRFYWTVHVAATSVDGFGEERAQTYSMVSFQEFSFVEIKGKVFLRLKNPGRNLSMLFNTLEKIAGFGFSVDPVGLIGTISERFQSSVDGFKLTGVKVANVVIASKVVARFEFASKDSIEDKTLSVYLKHPHTLEFCAYEVMYKNVRGHVSFYRAGQVKISEQLAGFLIEVVENNL